MKFHLLQFANEAAAIADPTVGAYHYPLDEDGNPPHWNTSVTFPNTGVWLNTVKQAGWWTIIARPATDTTLALHAACKLAWNADNAAVLGGSWTGTEISQAYVSPVPSGS